jgi:hypothetical protein
MIPATIAFVIVAGLLIAGVVYALWMMDRRTEQIRTEVMLDDAAYAITREDRTAIEADAFTQAATGWDMPDYAQHHEAAKALVEVYDLEQEMLADLDSIITVLEDPPHDRRGRPDWHKWLRDRAAAVGEGDGE